MTSRGRVISYENRILSEYLDKDIPLLYNWIAKNQKETRRGIFIMFQSLGFQLYTVRDLLESPESADAAYAEIRKLGYTEVHAVGSNLYEDLLFKHGISVVGNHYDVDKIFNEPQETMALHRRWNTTNVGVGGMPVSAREDLTSLKAFVKQFNETAKRYGEEGFMLTYHNHNFEFARIDGCKTIMDILYEELDPQNISFVLDTCWVAAGCGDVTDWMEKLKGRIDILHLKDAYIAQKENRFVPRITEVGNGNLAWDKIMVMAEKIGVKHYVVEQDNNWSPTPIDSLRISAEFLEKYKI